VEESYETNMSHTFLSNNAGLNSLRDVKTAETRTVEEHDRKQLGK